MTARPDQQDSQKGVWCATLRARELASRAYHPRNGSTRSHEFNRGEVEDYREVMVRLHNKGDTS